MLRRWSVVLIALGGLGMLSAAVLGGFSRHYRNLALFSDPYGGCAVHNCIGDPDLEMSERLQSAAGVVLIVALCLVAAGLITVVIARTMRRRELSDDQHPPASS